jgi:hypothetical protein
MPKSRLLATKFYITGNLHIKNFKQYFKGISIDKLAGYWNVKFSQKQNCHAIMSDLILPSGNKDSGKNGLNIIFENIRVEQLKKIKIFRCWLKYCIFE